MGDVVCKDFDYNKDLKEQRALFVDCFPETIGIGTETEGHYLWKFQSFPAEKKSSEYIATIDDEMVGYYAAIPYRYQIDGKEKRVAMVCDVMTSSHHRGKGIFVKLGKYSTDKFAEEGYAFSTGYPIREAVIPGHKKAGWTMSHELPLYMKFLKLNSFLKPRKLGFLSWVANACLGVYNGITYKPSSKDYDVKIYNSIDEINGYEQFEKEWRAGIKNALIKDKDFVKWRYGAPGKKYWFICAYKGDKLVGFISTRAIVKEGVPSLGVADISVLASERKCLNNLYAALAKLAKEHKKEAIMFVMSRPDAKAYRVKAHGYLKSPFTFHFIYKKYDDTINSEVMDDINNWHLMFVDSDDL